MKQSRILTPPQLIKYDGDIVGYGSSELRVE
ncbi:TPA: protein mom, partial [Serratia marcescens]